MLNFWIRKSGLLGVDIGSSTVKVLALRSTAGVLQLQDYVVQPLPSGVVVERRIVEVDSLVRCLRQALSALRCSTRSAAVAVPSSAVIFRHMEVDAGLSEEELEGQVLLEAQQCIPYPLADVAIDFEYEHDSNEHDGDAPPRRRVLLTACRKDTVAGRVEALQAAGLKATAVDVESCVMARASGLLPQSTEGVVAVVDIGATLTTLHVLREGQSLYTREQLSAAATSLDGIARQVQRSLQLFLSSGDHQRIDMVLLAGGVAAAPGFVALMRERLAVPVAVADPFAHMKMSTTIDQQLLRQHAPALMSACGLALRSRR